MTAAHSVVYTCMGGRYMRAPYKTKSSSLLPVVAVSSKLALLVLMCSTALLTSVVADSNIRRTLDVRAARVVAGPHQTTANANPANPADIDNTYRNRADVDTEVSDVSTTTSSTASRRRLQQGFGPSVDTILRRLPPARQPAQRQQSDDAELGQRLISQYNFYFNHISNGTTPDALPNYAADVKRFEHLPFPGWTAINKGSMEQINIWPLGTYVERVAERDCWYRGREPPHTSCRFAFEVLGVEWVRIYAEGTFDLRKNPPELKFLEGWMEAILDDSPVTQPLSSIMFGQNRGGNTQAPVTIAPVTEERAARERVSTRPNLWSMPLRMFTWSV